MNQYRPQAQRRDGTFTLFVSLVLFAALALPALYFLTTDVIPSIHNFIETLHKTH